jgi:hypothetical protein
MEFRLWNEPLSASVFDNHTRTPKSYNGNTSASSYDNLLLRLPLDDNKDYSVTANMTASAIQHLKTYPSSSGVSGSDFVNGFTGNFYRTLTDQEKLKVPNVGPNRRNATKIRIEDNTLAVGTSLSPDVRNEVSSQDFAPIDSNRLGIYFSPVDVVNEDIVYSIADLSFDDLVGDPRDEFKHSYGKLSQLRREYFKRYSKSNNFWDYLRLLTYYDKSIFTQLTQLLPARADATLGVLVEPNILERHKEVLGRKPEFDNRYYANAEDFDEGIMVTRTNTENNESNLVVIGSYDTYYSQINLTYDSGSDVGFLGKPSIFKNVIGNIDNRFGFGSTYATASTAHGTDNFDPIGLFVENSRTAEKNQEFIDGAFTASQFQSVAYDSNLYRVFYQGTLHTRENAPDNKEPVEITQVAPNVVVTTGNEASKLKVK